MRYFDYNATAPLLPQAAQAWLEASEKYIGNASSQHRLGGRADAALNDAREKLAAFLNCEASEIVWTSGATESNNLALWQFANSHPSETEVWISSIEHPAVLIPARAYFGKGLRLIPVTREGVVEIDWICERLKSIRPAVIAMMAANNETGVLQPIEQVAALCRDHDVPFFCDATQWFGKLPADGVSLGDFISGSAHKFGGPKGVGFLKYPADRRVRPLLLGGMQEEGRRAGTENVPGVLAMIRALEAREKQMNDSRAANQYALNGLICRELKSAIPGIKVLGENQQRLWNTITVIMPEADCRMRWVVKLDKAGFAVSTGSACASGEEKPSHVLQAMGLAEYSGRGLRFSSGWETSEADWLSLAGGLKEIAAKVLRGAVTVPNG